MGVRHCCDKCGKVVGGPKDLRPANFYVELNIPGSGPEWEVQHPGDGMASDWCSDCYIVIEAEIQNIRKIVEREVKKIPLRLKRL